MSHPVGNSMNISSISMPLSVKTCGTAGIFLKSNVGGGDITSNNTGNVQGVYIFERLSWCNGPYSSVRKYVWSCNRDRCFFEAPTPV